MNTPAHIRTTLFIVASGVMFALAPSSSSARAQLSSILSEGLTLHKETTSSGMMGQGGRTQKETVYFSGNAMKQTSDDGTDVIVRFDQGKIINVDHNKKTYTEITPEQLQNMMNKAADMAENKEAVEAMRKMMGHTADQISVRKQGPGESIAGYSTEKYSVTGPIQMEVWAAPDLKVPAAYYDIMKVRAPANPFLDLGKLYEEFKKIDGITLKEAMTMNMMGMKMTTTSIVTSVERGPISDSTFEIPAGYRLVPFEF